eukprot:832495_1
MSANCNCNPFSKYPITLHIAITLVLISLKFAHSNNIPSQIKTYGQYDQQMNENLDSTHELMLLQEILRYSQHNSNLLQSSNMNPSSYSSLSEFTDLNTDAINEIVIQNEQICSSLELESEACYTDCIYYVSPITILLDNTTTDEFSKVLSWYQMGGDPVSWYATGNIDMCNYMDGTYCYTPIAIQQGPFVMNLQEHGCCVPGTCVGEDAIKVLHQNAYCYQGYNFTYNTLMFGGMFEIENICEPLERDLGSAGFCMVVTVFILFLTAVIIASVRTQYLTEEEDNNNMDRNVYDDNWFLYSFSIQNLWKIFTRKRPKNKSEFNFLDGIRVISMSWVIWGHVYVYYLMSSPSNQAVLMPFDSTAKQYPYVFTQFYMMIAEYGFFSVDSFYYLSGFLAAFALYRQINKYGNKVIRMSYLWIPLSYLHRFLRIFPMMAFILFVQWFVADQLPYGYRVTSRDINNDLCKDSWYKVLFFYANLEKDMTDLGCMGHLWYIQCDMQMFLFLPWVLLLFK